MRGVRRFVHGSTIGVYGGLANGLLDEMSPLSPDNPYGRTKAEAERVVRDSLTRSAWSSYASMRHTGPLTCAC